MASIGRRNDCGISGPRPKRTTRIFADRFELPRANRTKKHVDFAQCQTERSRRGVGSSYYDVSHLTASSLNLHTFELCWRAMREEPSDEPLPQTLRFVFMLGGAITIGWFLMFVLLQDRW